MKAKILIVEDEAHIAEGLSFNLKKLGHITEVADTGPSALEKWVSFRPDLIVLDIMLPQIDGHEVLKQIRSKDKKLPILILSAKGQPSDRIKGLSIGGDDYLGKPFLLEEFILRVKRLLERASWEGKGQLNSAEESVLTTLASNFKFGPNVVNFSNDEALTPHGKFSLTEQEIKLLKIFIHHQGRALSRKELLKMAWGYDPKMSTRTLDNFIVRLRRYFEVDPKHPAYFKSIRSKGYLFDPGSDGEKGSQGGDQSKRSEDSEESADD